MSYKKILMAVTVLFIPVTGFVVLLRFGLYKKYAAELHEEGNIVDIEYYMRLVHNYDEKKKKPLQFLKPCCCYPVLFSLDENISIK